MIAAKVTSTLNGPRAASLVAGVESTISGAVIEFASGVLTDLITQTPKRSGQAASNWLVSVDAPDETYIELREAVKHSVYDSEAVAEALSVGLENIAAWQPGQTIYISNNAPYIERLDQGYSPQAPALYVEGIVAARFHALQTAKVIA